MSAAGYGFKRGDRVEYDGAPGTVTDVTAPGYVHPDGYVVDVPLVWVRDDQYENENGYDPGDLLPLGPRCSCARNTDGSVTRMLCSAHADADPCLTMAAVTGKRRTGTIRRGTCTACGWTAAR